MEWLTDYFTIEVLMALLTIVAIDLVLAGDNALVIGLAARNLPQEHQKKAVIWGTVGAVAIRVVATIGVVYLLKIPGLLLGGGLMLVWVAYKLLVDDSGHEIKAANGLGAAIKTIIIADALMGIDNVIAVAGAAHGDTVLVIIGLLISVPIMVWGSTLILKLIDRFPVVVTIGSGVLAFTAAKMIAADNYLKGFFEENPLLKWLMVAIIIIAVIVTGKAKQKKNKEKNEEKKDN